MTKFSKKKDDEIFNAITNLFKKYKVDVNTKFLSIKDAKSLLDRIQKIEGQVFLKPQEI